MGDMAEVLIEEGTTAYSLHLSGDCGFIGPCDYCEKEENNMAETVQGVVEKINLNDNGFYGVLMGDEWYGAGKFKPKFNEGDEVSFDYSMNGKYRNMEFKSVSILEKGAAPANAVSSPTSSGGAKTNWELKDKRITYLASRKDAIEITRLAIDKDALPLPAKKDTRLEVILEFVDDLTDTLYKKVYGESFSGEE